MAEIKTRWRAVGRLSDADPRQVAGFVVQGRLGEGGMGVVYLADHPQFGPAALKFVHAAAAADATFRARFRREVEAANRVDSPRIARVVGADLDADIPWLATTFVDGPTLAEAVSDGEPMVGDRLLALAAALADALTAIHAAGVVHRDLKPANILLTPETPVVIDFGIAAARESTELTKTGMQLGTPGWMAPEQVRGRRAGPATDVFAWGLVVAYAASGRPPFGRGPADALYYRVVHQRPMLPTLPPPLDRLVPSALIKDPRQRLSVADLVAGLEAGVDATLAGGLGDDDGATTGSMPTIVAAGWGPEALPSDGPPADPPGAPTEVTRRGVPTTGGASSAGAPAAGASPVPVADPAALRPDPGQGGGADAPATAATAASATGNGSTPGGSGAAGDATAVTAAAPGAPGAGAAAAAGRPKVGAVPGGALRRDDATRVRPTQGPTFFCAGAEHDDPATLASALQWDWDQAVDQAFSRRDPVWITDLRAFLHARGLLDAERILVAGARDDLAVPRAATMARLLLAIDPGIEPRMGELVLTPAGLAGAAHAVADGKSGADRAAARLAEVHDARLLRLWRAQPGMEHAADVDERWQANTQAYDRLIGTVGEQAGQPAPGDRSVASARLLLHALGGRYERQQARQLRSARKTAASDVDWWRRLADDAGKSPAAAALAVGTVERARTAGEAARQAESARRDAQAARAQAEALRRAQEEEARRLAEAQRRARPAPPMPPGWGPGAGGAQGYRPPPPVPAPSAKARRAAAKAAARGATRLRPTPNARPFVARGFGLVLAAAVFVSHLWLLSRFKDDLVAFYDAAKAENLDTIADSRTGLRGIENGVWFVVFVLLVSVAIHVVTRVVDSGRPPAVIRAYAVASAVADGLLAVGFLVAVSLAVLVVQAAAVSPFSADIADQRLPESWGWLVLSHGIIAVLAIFLGIRAAFRLLRALFGGPVGYPAHHPTY